MRGPTLYEYHTGNMYGPASEQSVVLYNEALARGQNFFEYPYHGYFLRMIVKGIEPERK